MGNGRNNNHINSSKNSTGVNAASPGKSKWVDDSGEFSTFSTRAAGTQRYEDDGGATDAYMRSITNTESVYNTLTDSEKRAIEAWISGDMMGTSRLSFSQLSYHQQAIVRAMDKLVDNTVLTHGITVHSLGGYAPLTGSSRTRPKDLDALVGATIRLNGHMSTGAASDGLTIGSVGKPAEYVISIPGGVKGAGAWIGNPSINRYWKYHQREWVAGDAGEYLVTGVGRKGGRDVIYVTWQKAGKHKR